jgi:uncharacterized protein (TIGR02118 family)
LCCTASRKTPRRSTATIGTCTFPWPRKLPGLRRYTISRDQAPVRGGEPYYLVAELDWDDMAALQRALQSPEGQAAARDVPTFASGGVRSMAYELEEV